MLQPQFLTAQPQQNSCITEAGAVEEAWMASSRQTYAAFRDVEPDDNFVIYIPIKHHVVMREDGTGGIDPLRLDGLLDTLNAHFAASHIRFFNCGLPEEIYSDEWSTLRTDDEGDMCDAHDVPNVLNIYYVDGILHGTISLCGYTYFPGGQDRMLLDAACALNSNTMIHEMGHYFSLPHTQGSQPPGVLTDELVDGSNCAIAGDGFCDTAADPGLNYFTVNTACQYTGTAVDANGDAFNPPLSNYMSYSRVSCRNKFSSEQAMEMTFSALYDRSYLQCSCFTPHGLTANASITSAVVNWQPVGGATGYQLSGRRLGTEAFRSVYVNATTKTVGGLAPGQEYEWKVRAQCSDGTITEYSQLDTFATPHQRRTEQLESAIDTELDVQIWPNPVRDYLSVTVQIEQAGALRATLRDAAGKARWRSVERVESGSNQLVFDREDLESGIYFLHLVTAEGQSIEKVLFEARP